MFDNQLFTVIACDGDYFDSADPYTNSLRYDNLSWDDACTLARLSFNQGFEIVIWKTSEESGDEQTEDAVSKETV